MNLYEISLVFITIITLLIQGYVLLMVHMVQFKSPSSMLTYRYYLNTVIVWDMLFSFFFGILLQPVPITETIIVGVRGFIYHFGYLGMHTVVGFNYFDHI